MTVCTLKIEIDKHFIGTWEASSPERTPGRSPEGHVASLVQEASSGGDFLVQRGSRESLPLESFIPWAQLESYSAARCFVTCMFCRNSHGIAMKTGRK